MQSPALPHSDAAACATSTSYRSIAAGSSLPESEHVGGCGEAAGAVLHGIAGDRGTMCAAQPARKIRPPAAGLWLHSMPGRAASAIAAACSALRLLLAAPARLTAT